MRVSGGFRRADSKMLTFRGKQASSVMGDYGRIRLWIVHPKMVDSIPVSVGNFAFLGYNVSVCHIIYKLMQ